MSTTTASAASGYKRLGDINLKQLFDECSDYVKYDKKDSRLLFKLVDKLERIRKGIR